MVSVLRRAHNDGARKRWHGHFCLLPDQPRFCIQFIYFEDNYEESGCRAAPETRQKIGSELSDVDDEDRNCCTRGLSESRFKVRLFSAAGTNGGEKRFISIANVN